MEPLCLSVSDTVVMSDGPRFVSVSWTSTYSTLTTDFIFTTEEPWAATYTFGPPSYTYPITEWQYA